MKKLQLLLIIPAAIFEIFFLGVCWIAALIHKPTGRKLTEWSIENLPAKSWYMGDEEARQDRDNKTL